MNNLSLTQLQLLRLASHPAPCHKPDATDAAAATKTRNGMRANRITVIIPQRGRGFPELLEVAPCSDVWRSHWALDLRTAAGV